MLYNFKLLGDESIHREDGVFTVIAKDAAAAPKFGPAPARSYYPNNYGLYNTCGNVAERLAEPGRTKGGSFDSPGYDIRIYAPDTYAGTAGPSPFIGFRPVVSVRKKEG